jgi:hypothetical protein
MGLFDVPAGIFSWVDAGLVGFLPAPARIAVWGVVGAVASLGLYWLLSPQQRMIRIAEAEQRLKRAMWEDDTAMAEGLAAASSLIRLALVRLGIVLVPVLIAALPVVSLTVWLDTQYGLALPRPGQTASIKAEPNTAQVRWVAANNTGNNGPSAHVEVLDRAGQVLQSLPIVVPIPVIEKRAWWNRLIGNPLGYLANDSPVERVEISLEKQQYLSIGPDWIRGWEALFLVTLLVGSVLLKWTLRIR